MYINIYMRVYIPPSASYSASPSLLSRNRARPPAPSGDDADPASESSLLTTYLSETTLSP